MISLSFFIIYIYIFSTGTIGAKIAKKMKKGVRSEIATDKELLLQRKADRSLNAREEFGVSDEDS